MKKIIALSTLRQLGLIIRILRIGFGDLAFYHLLTHAIFKALLFICAGIIIHIIIDNQDIRFIGGLRIYIPITSLCLNISNLSLCGIPFLAGFYSKDLILEIVLISNLNLLIFILYYVSTGITMFYTIRLLIYLIINDYNLIRIFNIYDEDYIILKRIMILLFIRIFSGRILNWLIYNYPYIIYLSLNIKLIVIYFTIIGLFIGYLIRNINFYSLNKFLFSYKLRIFLCNIWFIPRLRTYGLRNIYLNYRYKLKIIVDLGWREYYRGYGLLNIIKNYSFFYYFYQINNFKIYLFRFILWIMIFIFIILII